MDSPIIGQLLLQVLLIALNAVFACAEIAVISMNDTRLARLAQQGDKRAIRLARLTSQPARFLATIQVAITLSGFLGSAFAAGNFSEPIVNLFVEMGAPIPRATLNTICVVLITLILSYFTLVFGELVPKRLAMKNTEKLALGMAGMLTFISRVFAPLVWVLSLSTNAILRLLRVDPEAEGDAVTEEEIRMMIDAGLEKGTIDAEENTLLQNVFEFDDLDVGDIATHRTRVDFLWMKDTQEEWEEQINTSLHQWYPVCQDSADQVVGVLNAGIYLRMQDRSRENVLQAAVSEPFFVPESMKADALFEEMKKQHLRFAIVLDEYGGVAGIVTLNDLLEELVGDLGDTDITETQPVPAGKGVWRIRGIVPLDAVVDTLHVSLPLDDFETWGGLVLSTQSKVPEDGARFTCTINGLSVQVLRMENHRVAETLVHFSEPGEPTA